MVKTRTWLHINSGSGIYSIENLVNGKLYIGYSVTMRKRCNEHCIDLRAGIHENPHLQMSWNKYGDSNFKFDEIVQCEEQYLCSEENYWCNLLNTHDRKYGYNQENTGQDRHIRLRPETIKKRQDVKNENAKKRGYFVEEKYLIARREKWKGKPVHPNMIIASVAANSKKVVQYTLEGEIVGRYKSASEAYRKTGAHFGMISTVCRGLNIHGNGFVWRFEGDSFDKYPTSRPVSKKRRAVLQYTKDGQLIKEHLSLLHAKIETGIAQETIRSICNSKEMQRPLRCKYLWKWK